MAPTMDTLRIEITDPVDGPTGDTLELSEDRTNWKNGPRAYLCLGGDLPQDSEYARLTVEQAERVGAWLLEWAASKR